MLVLNYGIILGGFGEREGGILLFFTGLTKEMKASGRSEMSEW